MTGGPQTTSPSGASQAKQPSGQTPGDGSTPATTPSTSATPAAQTSAPQSPGSDPARADPQSASRQTEPGNPQGPAQSQTAAAPKNAPADKAPTLTNLRQEFEKVNWNQFDADKRAVQSGQTSLDKLSADRRDNLQRGNDVIEQYSKYDQNYKSALVVQKTELNDVKQLHEDSIKERDKAAFLGKVGSAGLGIINAGDALANAAAATKIPVVSQLGYAYVAGRGIGDKLVSAGSKIDEFFGGKGSQAVDRAMDKAVDSALGGNSASAAARSGGSGSGDQGGGPSGLTASGAQKASGSDKSGLQQATNLAQGARDGQSAVTSIANMKDDFQRADASVKNSGSDSKTANSQKEGKDSSGDSKPFSQVETAGKVFDSSLKTVNSIADLQTANKSGDANKIVDAQLNVAAKASDTAHVMAESLEKQAAAGGGEASKMVSFAGGAAQVTRAAVGGVQAGRNLNEAYAQYKEGNTGAAFNKSAEAVKNVAEVFDKGKNVESVIKAKESLEKALDAKTNSERAQYALEYAGNAVGAADGFVPGAGNTSQALLSSGQVFQNAREYNEFSSYGTRDPVQAGVDRFQSVYDRNDAMLNRLNGYYQPQIQIQRP